MAVCTQRRLTLLKSQLTWQGANLKGYFWDPDLRQTYQQYIQIIKYRIYRRIIIDYLLLCIDGCRKFNSPGIRRGLYIKCLAEFS